jgi:hypothetical protein
MLRPTASRPVCLVVKPHSGPKTRFLLLSDSCGFVDVGRFLWREDESVVYSCCWSRQRSHSGVQVQRDSWPYFTASDSILLQPGRPGPRICVPQEQGGPVIPQALGSLFFASCDSQCYGGGFNSYLAGNTSRLHDKDQPVNVVQGNNRRNEEVL